MKTMKTLDKRKIKKILFITLSNLGDIILTTPVFEILHSEFPEARIDIVTGAPGKDIFHSHRSVGMISVRRKKQSIKERIVEIINLRKKRYDLIVDLRNTLISYALKTRFRSGTAPFKLGIYPQFKGSCPQHKVKEHLLKLFNLGIKQLLDSHIKFFIPVTDDEKNYVKRLMVNPAPARDGAKNSKKSIIICPGAKSPLKMWSTTKYAELADKLISEFECKVFVTGDENDQKTIQHLTSSAREPVIDLCCKTSIGCLLEMMRRSDLVITNDSAPLHVASASGTPTIAIFGPSDDEKYGPLSKRSVVIKPEVSCRPCEEALCDINNRDRRYGCISDIEVDEVFEAAKRILGGNE